MTPGPIPLTQCKLQPVLLTLLQYYSVLCPSPPQCAVTEPRVRCTTGPVPLSQRYVHSYTVNAKSLLFLVLFGPNKIKNINRLEDKGYLRQWHENLVLYTSVYDISNTRDLEQIGRTFGYKGTWRQISFL